MTGISRAKRRKTTLLDLSFCSTPQFELCTQAQLAQSDLRALWLLLGTKRDYYNLHFSSSNHRLQACHIRLPPWRFSELRWIKRPTRCHNDRISRCLSLHKVTFIKQWQYSNRFCSPFISPKSRSSEIIPLNNIYSNPQAHLIKVHYT